MNSYKFPVSLLTGNSKGCGEGRIENIMKPEDNKLPFNFETSLAELNTLVEQMEQGGLSLEQSLACFEKGIALTRACQQALSEAEQKVQILMQKNGETVLVDFDENE